jgi:hypothetical protein
MNPKSANTKSAKHRLCIEELNFAQKLGRKLTVALDRLRAHFLYFYAIRVEH